MANVANNRRKWSVAEVASELICIVSLLLSRPVIFSISGRRRSEWTTMQNSQRSPEVELTVWLASGFALRLRPGKAQPLATAQLPNFGSFG